MEPQNPENETSVDVQVVMNDLGKEIGRLTVEVALLKAALNATSETES